MNKIVDFWFSNEQLWFNCSSEEDQKITDLFEDQLINYNSLQFISKEDRLGHILILDQISRHVDRVRKTDYTSNYHLHALNLSNNQINEGLNNFKMEEICFILMPLRHSNDLHLLNKVLFIVNQLRINNKNNIYLKRFYQATVRSISSKIDPIEIQEFVNLNHFNNLLCQSCNFDYNCSIDLDITFNQIKDNQIGKIFRDSRIPLNITISLSGGVDSMVSAFILKKLNYNVTALMINYNNRDVSQQEVKMVSSWCNRHSIPFYVRHINEIHRTQDSDREFYESITKKIRFDSYKYLDNPVILGHNRDDCLENIFSNIEKKRSYNNLLGMEFDSTIDQVRIIRPMLSIPKYLILEFANNYNIPYLVDSTPSWSQRGQMRDILIPSINKFNPQLIPSIYFLADKFKDIYNSYQLMIESQIILEPEDQGVKVKFINNFDYQYWTTLIHKSFCYLNQDRPSYKSIQNLIESLKLGKNTKMTIILTKNVSCQIENNYIYIYSKLK